jgi:8-oxo-dGTP diphosphatase
MQNLEPAVMVLLIQNEKVLLQLRTKDAPRFPAHWGGFGGRSEPEESIPDAAIREISEELGLTLAHKDLRELMVQNVHRDGRQQRLHCLVAELLSPLADISIAEGDGFALFDLESADALRLTPETRQAVNLYFETQAPRAE